MGLFSFMRGNILIMTICECLWRVSIDVMFPFLSLYVLSLGGSMMVPDKIDTGFLSEFKELVLNLVNQGEKFIIMVGGGQTCRTYRDSARELCQPSQEDLDWIGIMSTKLNAELLRVLFSGKAHKKVIEPGKPPETDKPIKISSGFL